MLQIIRGNRDNLLFSYKSICCDPFSELCHRDSSYKGSKHMFLLRNKNYMVSFRYEKVIL